MLSTAGFSFGTIIVFNLYLMIYLTYLTNSLSSGLLMIQIYDTNIYIYIYIYIYYEYFIELERVVNKELKNLYLWLGVSRLALNIEKSSIHSINH